MEINLKNKNELLSRSSGLLLHISSLPGKYGIGTMGQEAFDFIDFLEKSGQTYWQILPTTPTLSQFGFSPYSSYSSFAGDPLLISVEEILKKKWADDELKDFLPKERNDDFINFSGVEDFKYDFLKNAYECFFKNGNEEEKVEFKKFKKNEAYWLDDFSLFVSLAKETGTFYWVKWKRKVRERDFDELNRLRGKLREEIEYWKFTQFLFFSQWAELLKKAKESGVSIIGDIPIYVNFDSADTWSNQEIFQLNEETLKAEKVSGVPPDYFSKNGQKWGNPLYKWFAKEKKGLNEETFIWWKKRVSHLLKMVDIIRIDHFRGFEAYWAVPIRAKTAIKGKWMNGPGMEFFLRLEKELGKLPLIAEDLGIITKGVEELRDNLNLPGMKILQFAFDFNPKNIYLPGNFEDKNCIVYTGTHDNNTTNGWFYGKEIDDNTRNYILEYIGADNWDEFHWKFIRLAMSSTSVLSIIPVQDVLGFSEEFRMNTPGESKKNWRWKLADEKLESFHSDRLFKLTKTFNRLSDGDKK